jgi:hypothetical protein
MFSDPTSFDFKDLYETLSAMHQQSAAPAPKHPRPAGEDWENGTSPVAWLAFRCQELARTGWKLRVNTHASALGRQFYLEARGPKGHSLRGSQCDNPRLALLLLVKDLP